MAQSTTYMIARRLYQGEHSASARPAVRVALLGMVIGVMVMMIAISVVIGFKETVRSKVTGFGGHIQVVSFDNNNTYEMLPILMTDSLIGRIQAIDGVANVQRFATKPGIIKTDDAFQSCVYKGIEQVADQAGAFFAESLTEGQMPQEANQVLVSRMQADMLKLAVGDRFYCYYIQDDIKARRYTVSGIYDTQFQDYDKLFVIGNIDEVRRLNEWDSTQVSGIEIRVNDFDRLDDIAYQVYTRTANRFDTEGNGYYTQTIEELNPAIFSWLRLLDMNVWVILILMMAVSGFSIISGLIILILDNIQFVGTMKAMGAGNAMLRRIFITQAGFLILRGMLWGNILAMALCALQYYMHILPLDASVYYVAYVPISFTWGLWAIANLAFLMISLFVLLAPSLIVTRISPAKVMHFE